MQTSPLIHFKATDKLRLLFRSTSNIFVQFDPVFGGTEYSIAARNSQYGVVERDCDSITYICSIVGLKPASVYTLWLRTCRRDNYRFCDLRAIPLDVTTLPEG